VTLHPTQAGRGFCFGPENGRYEGYGLRRGKKTPKKEFNTSRHGKRKEGSYDKQGRGGEKKKLYKVTGKGGETFFTRYQNLHFPYATGKKEGRDCDLKGRAVRKEAVGERLSSL